MVERMTDENVKCYGQRPNCSGYRKFLIERHYCELAGFPPPRKLSFPIAVWVGAETIRRECGHRAWLVEESSVRELAAITGRHLRSGVFPICEKMGRFVE